MNLVKYLIVVFTGLVLLGCQEDHDAILHNPKASDLEGTWEGVSFWPTVNYGLIRFYSDGTAKIVVGMEREVGIVGRIDQFQSGEHDFKVRLVLDDGVEKTEDSEFLKGVVKSDQLCFHFEGEQKDQVDLKACFIRLEKAADLRSKALKLLD